ncbi:hypothetical protein ABT160_23565 [Streptomyces sp. NPDC001941]|uniref:hypothetical protein n=1 Tax=Streptomyces sp. NPDC001941 TaxID=3154659 RepID=UPI003331563D
MQDDYPLTWAYRVLLWKYWPLANPDAAAFQQRPGSIAGAGDNPPPNKTFIPAAVSVTYTLDAPAQASVTLSLDEVLKAAPDFEPYKYCFAVARVLDRGAPITDQYVEDESMSTTVPGSSPIIFGGPVWNAQAGIVDRTLTLDGRDFLSFYERRLASRGGQFQTIDRKPSVLLQEMFDDANANWGIGTLYSLADGPKHPTWRYRKYMRFQETLAQKAYAMADMPGDEGYYLRCKAFVSPGKFDGDATSWNLPILRHVVIATGTRKPEWLNGRTGTSKDVELTAGRNCEITDVHVDGTGYSSVGYVIGERPADELSDPTYVRWDNDDQKAVLPIQDTIVNAQTGKSDADMKRLARQAVSFGRDATITPKVVTYPRMFLPEILDPNTGRNKVKLTARGEHAIGGAAQWGALDKAPYVIVQAKLQVMHDGSDRMELELAQESKFLTAPGKAA